LWTPWQCRGSASGRWDLLSRGRVAGAQPAPLRGHGSRGGSRKMWLYEEEMAYKGSLVASGWERGEAHVSCRSRSPSSSRVGGSVRIPVSVGFAFGVERSASPTSGALFVDVRDQR